jgi:hypothetical protein
MDCSDYHTGISGFRGRNDETQFRIVAVLRVFCTAEEISQFFLRGVVRSVLRHRT